MKEIMVGIVHKMILSLYSNPDKIQRVQQMQQINTFMLHCIHAFENKDFKILESIKELELLDVELRKEAISIIEMFYAEEEFDKIFGIFETTFPDGNKVQNV